MEEQEKRIIEKERIRSVEEMNRKGGNSYEIVKYPQYKIDPRLKVDREFNMPDDKIYIGLGWDEDSTTKRKHYRKFINCELENCNEFYPEIERGGKKIIMSTPF
jgi:hypothetical protein